MRRLARSVGFRNPSVPTTIQSRCLRSAGDWDWDWDWRAILAKSPASCNLPEATSKEQRADPRSNTAFAAKTGLDDPGAAWAGGLSAYKNRLTFAL